MPARQDPSSGGASPAVSPPQPAPPRRANGKGKAASDDMPEEEDLALKQRLERCVLQAQDADLAVQTRAIVTLRQEIRTKKNSFTDILKTLKFLRPYYGTLKNYFETMPASIQKKAMAGILSVMAIAMSTEVKRESLKYCKMASLGSICSWGDVYVRNLACEIVEEFQQEDGTPTSIESILGQVLEIVKFYMKHNAEPEALDLLMEVGYLEMLSGEQSKTYFAKLLNLVGFTNFRRACLYFTSCSKYLAPDRMVALSVVYFMYMKFGELASALRIGLLLDDNTDGGSYVKKVFAKTNDFPLKQQFAYMIARYGLCMVSDDEMTADYNEKNALLKILYNTKLSEGYLTLARDIEVMEPKSPEDIYKVHLIGRDAKRFTPDSERQNMAATFVNAFANAGFCHDKLVSAPSDSSENWIFKNKEIGRTCAVASLGMIYMWDPDSGLAQLDKYLRNDDTYAVAGALLGMGIVSCGVKNDCDTAIALVSEYISTGASIVRNSAILGLGIAFAGSHKEELKALLSHIMSDSQDLEELVFSAISLGLVFIGSCNTEIALPIISVLRGRSTAELAQPITRLLPVALGLLYLGKQEKVTAIVEVSLTLDENIKNYCATTLMSLAFAGSGNVNTVQKLLHICLHQGGSHRGPAVLGIAFLSMAEELGGEMAVRSLEHLLRYGDHTIRRAVPLALAALFISDPKVNVMDTLVRLSHDTDIFVSMAAIISLGLTSAGTNNARVSRLLRELSNQPHDDHLFCVRIAQGLVHLGKGLMTLDPCHSDRLLVSPVALAGLVVVLHAWLNMQSTILGKYPYMLYILVLALQPRMLLTMDEDLEPLFVPVRVGQAVDVAGQAGQPRTITGFRTQNTPVLLAAGERAELATEKYIPLAPVLEGFVILRKNPEYSED